MDKVMLGSGWVIAFLTGPCWRHRGQGFQVSSVITWGSSRLQKPLQGKKAALECSLGRRVRGREIGGIFSSSTRTTTIFGES